LWRATPGSSMTASGRGPAAPRSSGERPSTWRRRHSRRSAGSGGRAARGGARGHLSVGRLSVRRRLAHPVGHPPRSPPPHHWATARPEAGARPLVAASRFEVDHMTYPYGVHFAQVEVDEETGQVRVLRYFVAYDGRPSRQPDERRRPARRRRRPGPWVGALRRGGELRAGRPAPRGDF